MSILIKGLKMPKDKPLRIVLNPNGQLFVDHGITFTEYEAVELPDHGDLIDRSALMFDTEERYCTGCASYRGWRCKACWVDDMNGELVDAPVVIPAERSEE